MSGKFSDYSILNQHSVLRNIKFSAKLYYEDFYQSSRQNIILDTFLQGFSVSDI